MERPGLVALLLPFVLCGLMAAPATAQERDPERWYALEPDATVAAAQAPEGMDRSSPRATMRSFFDAIDAGRPDAAAATLRPMPTADREPARLAEMLGEVLERQVWLDFASLSDRADAAVETMANNPMAGKPRRSVSVATLGLGRFPVTIRLNRFRPVGEEPIWLFAQQTVSAIPALYARYGPGWVESRIPPWWRGPAILGLRKWELAGLPLVAVAAFTVGWATSALLGLLRRPLPSRWMRRGVEEARTPLGLLAGALTARLATGSALGFSAPVTALVNPALLILISVAVMLAILRVIDAVLERVTHRYVGQIDDRESRDERQLYTSISAARRLVTLIAFLFVSGVLLWELDAFGDLGLSFLASAGVLTVILGVAAQTMLGNILASLQIAIAKPIRIGDSVNYEGEWCYVESIFYTFVRLRVWDDRRLIVPVQHFVSKPFENWSMTNAKLTETFTLALDHDADPDALREAFIDIANNDEDAMQGEMLQLKVVDHSPEAQFLRFYATASDPSTAWAMHARLREEMLAWIRAEHPEWWPRERLRSPEPDLAAAAE